MLYTVLQKQPYAFEPRLHLNRLTVGNGKDLGGI